jgi:Mg-chelatase subunit ChlD
MQEESSTTPAPESKPQAKSFEDYRKQLDRDGLDVIVVFDSTGSMGGVILELKTRIKQVAQAMTAITPNARLGLVTYRDLKKFDLDDYEYTAKYIGMQTLDEPGLDRLQRFLRSCEAYGGGDEPEAVYEGLETAVKRGSWREKSRKVILIAGDAPPRAEYNGLARICALAKAWHRQSGGMVSCIDTTGNSRILSEFKEIATAGGGQAMFLDDERTIIKQIVIHAVGEHWRKQIEEAYEKATKGDVLHED